MVMPIDQTIRPAAESLVMIKANANKMAMSFNDNKKMASIFLDMHATLEMIADQKEKKAQQEATVVLFPIVVTSHQEAAAAPPLAAAVTLQEPSTALFPAAVAVQ